MDAHLQYWALAVDGDEEVTADATGRIGPRRFDTVAEWPAGRLDELAALRPDLVPEIIRRRPGELVQR